MLESLPDLVCAEVVSIKQGFQSVRLAVQAKMRPSENTGWTLTTGGAPSPVSLGTVWVTRLNPTMFLGGWKLWGFGRGRKWGHTDHRLVYVPERVHDQTVNLRAGTFFRATALKSTGLDRNLIQRYRGEFNT